MRQILIVDDEKLIRIGIKSVIPWEAVGIDRVYLAATAREALDILEKQRPQILLTDINMPNVNGIELVRRAKELVDNLKVIVLTGYDQHEYIRDSLRLHVDDFFLKPVDEKELERVLRKLSSQLDQEDSLQDKMLYENASYQSRIELALRRLLYGNASRADSDFLTGTPLGDGLVRRLLLVVPQLVQQSSAEDAALREYEITSICRSFISLSQGEFALPDGRGNILIVVQSGAEYQDYLGRIKKISDVLEMEYSTVPKFVQGGTFRSLDELVSSYRGIMALKENRSFLCGERRAARDSWENSLEKWTEELSQLLTACGSCEDLTAALQVCRDYQRRAQYYNLSAELLEQGCFLLISALFFDRSRKAVVPENTHLENFMISIRNADKNDIFHLSENFIEQIFNTAADKDERIITKAKAIISRSLGEDISVNSIAEQLYVSSTYFSRLFKSVEGIGCNSYIVQCRMEKAKELLRTTDLKSAKIAELAGYNDANYFSLAFKKYTGLSPMNFRQKVGEGSDGISKGSHVTVLQE